MRPFLKGLSLVVIAGLVLGNGYFFVKTTLLGDSLLKVEQEIKRLELENTELQAKLSSLNSLERLQKVALASGFTKKQNLLYLDNLKYALRYE